jgi:hypothetical protein
MKATVFGAILIVAVLARVPGAFGQIEINSVSYDIGGGAIGISTDTHTFHHNAIKQSFGYDEISVQSADSELAGGSDVGYADLASASFGAHARSGTIGVDVSASAESTNSTAVPIDTNASASASVTASWSDIADIFSNTLGTGTRVHVSFTLLLDGSVSATSFGDKAPNSHFTSGSIQVDLLGLGILAGARREAFANDNIVHSLTTTLQPESAIQLSYDTVIGELSSIGEQLTVTTNVSAETKSLFPAVLGTVGTATVASFGNTLRWGGISSVIDLSTGQPITDWTITSASGFDYSQPAVPEPSTAALLAIGWVVSWLARRR